MKRQEVVKILRWAGKRLYELNRRGSTTPPDIVLLNIAEQIERKATELPGEDWTDDEIREELAPWR